MSDPYAESGVNVSVGDAFSAYCGGVCRQSHSNSQFVKVHDMSKGHFRGPRGFSLQNLPPDCILTAGSDGIGTKTIISSSANDYSHSAYDLLAMVGGDFTRYGGLPLVFVNHLDLKTLGNSINHPAYLSALCLMDGLSLGAKSQGYVLLGGETAELNDCVTSENLDAILQYNWGGVMMGVYHPEKMITGEQVKSGDRVIALRENGPRSNGISLLRKGLRTKYGPKWYKGETADAVLAIEAAAAPSVLYDKFLAKMNGWGSADFEPIVRVKLIAHLSGGGIPDKFGEDLLFPLGYSATLNNLWEPPAVIRECAQTLGLSDATCYKTWSAGQGVLAVVSEGDVEKFIACANEHAIAARDAGYICETSSGAVPSIEILSGFTGKFVSF